MSVLHRLDDFLIDEGCQRFSDWTQDTWGISSFRVAQFCFMIAAVLAGISFVNSENFIRVLAIFVGMNGLMAILVLETPARHYDNLLAPTMNPLRASARGVRPLALIAVVIVAIETLLLRLLGDTSPEFISVALVGTLFAEILGVYFGSCTPKPPKPTHADAPPMEPSCA